MRRHYLITYDVSDDKRRTQIFECLKDHGDHAQFSVFFCDLSGLELAQLRKMLHPLVNEREDQVLFVDLGPDHAPLDAGIECLGKPYEPTVRTMII